MTEQRTMIGPYQLLDRFAVGGVAEIYRARDERDGRLVVIKRMRPDIDFDPEHQAGFLRELQIAMMAQHKNLIRGFDKGTVGGLDYGVLEYVDGQDLQKIIERAKKLAVDIPQAFATYITAEILEGLEFAWNMKAQNGQALGLVHRDLSPKNVFVRYDGEVRIGDFGSSLASLVERAESIVGSPGYMSPEQAKNDKLDQRSDLYACGLILYELLAGVPAFDVQKKSDAQVLKLHQKGEIRPVPHTVPESFRLVVEVACAPDPEDRFQSARAMRQALARTDAPPDPQHKLGIATLLRRLFADEYASSRLPGSPLSF